jgi:hypothetical protein
MKRTYIPRGADQQGRIKQTGVWMPHHPPTLVAWPGSPRRTGPEDEPVDGAHAATPLLADNEDAEVPLPWSDLIRLVAPFALGVAAVVALAFFGWR